MNFSSIKAQEKTDSLKIKGNPIIFGGISISYASGTIKGFTAGFNLNYQKNNNLFTFRYKENYKIEETEPGFIFRDVVKNRTFSEFSFLYGKRFIKDDFSYHFSGGLSYNNFVRKDFKNSTTTRTPSLGFPIEIGYTWFKAKKEKYKILYGLIPVGKPTGFSQSLGFNLYANVGKEKYYGFAIVLGFGWHKKYLE